MGVHLNLKLIVNEKIKHKRMCHKMIFFFNNLLK